MNDPISREAQSRLEFVGPVRPRAISVKEAKALGLKRFFTGRPCRGGHVGERQVANRACCVCNLEQSKYYSKQHYSANPGFRSKHMEAVRRWSQKNKDKKQGYNQKYREKNPEYMKQYRVANTHKFKSYSSKRRAQLLEATTSWGSEGLDDFYLAADMAMLYTGQPVHVDHLVPLAGKKVCGLHNEFNLQILYGVENIRKSNKFCMDSYVHHLP